MQTLVIEDHDIVCQELGDFSHLLNVPDLDEETYAEDLDVKIQVYDCEYTDFYIENIYQVVYRDEYDTNIEFMLHHKRLETLNIDSNFTKLLTESLYTNDNQHFIFDSENYHYPMCSVVQLYYDDIPTFACRIIYASRRDDNEFFIKTKLRLGDNWYDQFPYPNTKEILQCINFNDLIEPIDNRYEEILLFDFITAKYSNKYHNNLNYFMKLFDEDWRLLLASATCKNLHVSDEEYCHELAMLRTLPKSILVKGVLYERFILPYNVEMIVTKEPILCSVTFT